MGLRSYFILQKDKKNRREIAGGKKKPLLVRLKFNTNSMNKKGGKGFYHIF